MEQIKTFELPNSFAYKWVTALRSGEYEQLEGQLIECSMDYNEENHTPIISSSNTKKACCLGVAAVMCGATAEDLKTYGMPYEVNPSRLDEIKYPQELRVKMDREHHPKTPLPTLLATLNDGITLEYADNIKKEYPNVLFSKLPEDYYHPDDPDGDEIKEYYSFEDIAKFIENNVEFYDDED